MAIIGRPSSYADEDVIEAGMQIQAIGKTVTGFGLRSITGGGDSARLKAVWDAYKETQKIKMPAPAVAFPAEISRQLDCAITGIGDQIRKMLSALHQQALESAEVRVHQIEAEAARREDIAKVEHADAEVLVQDLEQKIEIAERKITDLVNKLDAAALMNTTLAEELKNQESQCCALDEECSRALSEADATRIQMMEYKKERDDALESAINVREELARTSGGAEALRIQFESLAAAISKDRTTPPASSTPL